MVTVICVPILDSDGLLSSTLPPLMWTNVPISSWQVFRTTSETAAIEGKASPRKPRELIENKSSSVYNLLVACLWKAKRASSFSMPIPLSVTTISRRPASFKSTFIEVACASTEFSTSSLTIETTFSTTSPAAILLDKSSLITLILLILLHLNHFKWFYFAIFYVFINSYFMAIFIYYQRYVLFEETI